MSSALEGTLLIIAKKLIEDYAAKASQGGLAGVDLANLDRDPEAIKRGLKQLIAINTLPVAELPKLLQMAFLGEDVSESQVLSKAVIALKTLVNQTSSPGVNPLLVNGILTSDVMSRVLQFPRCKGWLQTTPPKTPVAQPEDGDIPLRKIRYFVEGQLPALNDDPRPQAALDSLHEAWIAWQKVINLDARQTEKKENANVLIFRESLDAGEGGTLADANVGPPNGMVFHLRIDSGEDGHWTKKMFRTTMTHEIGHLLGLTHSTERGNMMSPMYDENVESPTSVDVERLLQLGYIRAVERPKAVAEGGFGAV